MLREQRQSLFRGPKLASVALAGVAIFLGCSHSTASEPAPLETCLSETDEPRTIVDACTAVIVSGELEAPYLAEAYFRRGFAWSQLREHREAQDDLEASLALDGNSLATYVALGDALWALEDFDAAVAAYSQALEIDPDLHVALYGRSAAHVKLNDLAAAQVDIERALEISPENALSHQGLGYFLFALRNYPMALDALNRSIELDDLNPRSYNLRGRTYTLMAEHDLAYDDLQYAILLSPDEAEYHADLAGLLSIRGEFERAHELFDIAIELDPNRPRIYYRRGVMYFILEDYDLALADFDRTLALTPSLATGYYSRSLVYCLLGNVEYATDNMILAALYPGYPEVLVIQNAMANRGYYEGPINGRMNYELINSIVDEREQFCSQSE